MDCQDQCEAGDDRCSDEREGRIDKEGRQSEGRGQECPGRPSAAAGNTNGQGQTLVIWIGVALTLQFGCMKLTELDGLKAEKAELQKKVHGHGKNLQVGNLCDARTRRPSIAQE